MHLLSFGLVSCHANLILLQNIDDLLKLSLAFRNLVSCFQYIFTLALRHTVSSYTLVNHGSITIVGLSILALHAMEIAILHVCLCSWHELRISAKHHLLALKE